MYVWIFIEYVCVGVCVCVRGGEGRMPSCCVTCVQVRTQQSGVNSASIVGSGDCTPVTCLR